MIHSPPFFPGGSPAVSPVDDALSMARSRVAGIEFDPPVRCEDLNGKLEALGNSISGTPRAVCLVSSDEKFAFCVIPGRHPKALATWASFPHEESRRSGTRGNPLLRISTSGDESDSAWTRQVIGLSQAEAYALAVASVAEKVLPAGRESDSVRPWFAPVEGAREAVVVIGDDERVICEVELSSAQAFPCFPSCCGYLISGDSVNDLVRELELADSRGLQRMLVGNGGRERLAIIAPSREKLLRRVASTLEKIRDPEWRGSPRNGVHRATVPPEGHPRVGWLFDGQGAQHFRMLEELIALFPRMREWLEKYESIVERGNGAMSVLYPWEGETPDPDAIEYLNAMEGGASVGFILNLGLAEILRQCGVPCEAMAGHSNGENSALIAAGILPMSDEEVLQCCRVLIAEAEHDLDVQGQALAVSLEDRSEFDSIVEEAEGSVFLALDNCPHQAILFGGVADIEKVRERLEESGAVCSPLPFQRPFHTPWFEAGAKSLAPFYEIAPVREGHTPVYSCAHLEAFSGTKAEIVAMALSQFHMTVRFRELIERLDRDGMGLFLEVGPGVSLKAFVDDTLGNNRALSLSSPQRKQSAEAFLSALADFYVRGVPVDFSPFGFSSAGSDAPADQQTTGADQMPVSTVPLQNAEILEQHFALMNEFLASQRRVFESCFGGAKIDDASPVEKPDETSSFDLLWPMLGDQIAVTGDRLEAWRTFTLQSDPFLLDHTLGRRASRRRADLYGIPVIPFTFSMELIAEAARRLIGRQQVVTAIEEARGYRWLAVDRDELKLRIEAVRIPRDGAESAVRVIVYELVDTGSEKKAFEGVVLLASQYPEAPLQRYDALDDRPPRRFNVPDFYRFGMFHGPRFQNIRRVKHLSETEVDADLQVFFLDDFFAAGESPEFQISPNLLDCAGQLTAYSMLEHVEGYYGLFPFRVEALRLYAPPPNSGVRVRARGSLEFDGHSTTMNFDYTNSSGGVLFRLESKQQRCFEFPKRYHMATFWPEAGDGLGMPWLEESGMLIERVDDISAEFLDQGWGIWKRALAHMILNENERKTFYTLPAEGPRRNEWLLGRAAAKAAVRRWARRELDLEIDSADVEICADDRGKPFVECPEIQELVPLPSLSISHTREVAVAAIDPSGQGIGLDLETPGKREVGEWLRAAFTTEELQLVPDPSPKALLPFWCAKEAAAKACGTGFAGRPEDWIVTASEGSRIVVSRGDQAIPVQLFVSGGDLVAACVLPENQPSPS